MVVTWPTLTACRPRPRNCSSSKHGRDVRQAAGQPVQRLDQYHIELVPACRGGQGLKAGAVAVAPEIALSPARLDRLAQALYDVV